MSALEAIGVADAVVAYRSERDGQLTIIDGHLRREILDQKIPVLVTDLTDEEADQFLATHDVLTTMAERDEIELGKLLAEMTSELPRELRVRNPGRRRIVLPYRA